MVYDLPLIGYQVEMTLHRREGDLNEAAGGGGRLRVG